MKCILFLVLVLTVVKQTGCQFESRFVVSNFNLKNSVSKDLETRNETIPPPVFIHNENTVNVSARRGSTIFLHCKVQDLGELSVSWYRRRGNEIQLITFGFQTYHNDNRFSLNYEANDDWRLRIRYIQDRDEGTYECQVSTHPPLMRIIHLHVVVPTIKILDDREAVLREKVFKVGSTIELQCQVSRVPTASTLQLSWYHGSNRLNYDASRGGISVKTELRGSVARSWLRVGGATIADSGIYYCNVTDLSAAGVNIHVVSDEYPAAIQQGVISVSLSKHLLFFTVFIWNILNPG